MRRPSGALPWRRLDPRQRRRVDRDGHRRGDPARRSHLARVRPRRRRWEQSSDAWPGEARRRPEQGLPNWSVREPLARWLAPRRASAAAGRRACSTSAAASSRTFRTSRPRASTSASTSSRTRTPTSTGRSRRSRSRTRASTSSSASRCSSTSRTPAQAVRELHRVTRPGGRVLASTHGTQVYHPLPEDHWRWTHAGLERLFHSDGDWRSVTVRPGAGTCACLGMLIATFIDLLAQRLHVVWARALLVNRVVNTVAAAIDGRSRLLREPVPGLADRQLPRRGRAMSRCSSPAAAASSARTSCARCSSAATTCACSTTSRPATAPTSRGSTSRSSRASCAATSACTTRCAASRSCSTSARSARCRARCRIRSPRTPSTSRGR